MLDSHQLRPPATLRKHREGWGDAKRQSTTRPPCPPPAEVPLLICCVARPEVDSSITRLRELARGEYAQRSREIRLKPLSSAESTTLASQLINGSDLPATLRKAILAKAEGNPFFVEEIVQSLIDLGGLVRDEASGGYRVTDQAVSIAIPDTLLGVIMARVDRLDDDLKQVLRLAAVIGRSFFYRLLVAITEAERELDASLAGLQARELVLEKAREPELEYIFKHALVQEATYESIVKRRRRELHRQVAAAIESLFADRLDDFYSLLAYHYTKAEDWEKAQEYLFKAADQAGTIAADAEALEHYEQALDAYTLAFGEKWDPLERAAIERKMGEALFRRGEHERAREHLLRALALLGRPFPRKRGTMRRAIVTQLLRQLGHRLFPFRRRSVLGHSVGTVEERFWIYHSLTFMDAGADQSQLLLALLLALNDVENAALTWQTAAACAGLGYACDSIPLRRISRFYHRRALRLAERAHEPFALATVHWLMGFHEYWATGDWAKALDYDLRAADEFHALGRFREWGTSMIEAVNVMVDEGRLAEAFTSCERIVALAEEAGDPVVVGWGLCRVGNIRSIEGDHEQAEETLRHGIELLLGALQPADAVSGFGWLAQCLARQGRAEEAFAILGDQSERIRKYGITGYFLRGCHAARATLSLLEAESRQNPERTVALREAKAACRDQQRTAQADVCGVVSACRSRGTYEWLRGRPRKAEAWWRKSLVAAKRLGARYEEALTHAEVGRLTGDVAALDGAATTFEAVGAQYDLARTRELLESARRESDVSAG